jgi:hypothetical protein
MQFRIVINKQARQKLAGLLVLNKYENKKSYDKIGKSSAVAGAISLLFIVTRTLFNI